MRYLCVSIQWPWRHQCADSRENARQAILGFLSGLPESGLLYTVKESEAILRNLIAASCEKSEGEVQYV